MNHWTLYLKTPTKRIRKKESSDSLDTLLSKEKTEDKDSDLMTELNQDNSSDSQSDKDPLLNTITDVISDKDMETKKFYDIIYEKFKKKKSPLDISDREIIDVTGLIKSYGVSEEINLSGIQKSKENAYTRALGNMQKKKKKGGPILEMQDTNFCQCQFYNDTALFCVFDGHSTANCSKSLVNVFPKCLKQYLKDVLFDNFDDIPFLWKTLYKNVDESLKQYEYEGSTSTTCLFWKNKGKKYLQCANVGDSTAFLYRNGKPIALSADHNLKKDNNNGERDRLKSIGLYLEPNATRMPGGLNVTRAFGDFCCKEPNSGFISEPYVSDLYEITKGDSHVIIASDGLWDVMSSEQVYNIIKDCTDSKLLSHRIIQDALRTGSCTDNITVIVISLK